MTQSTQQSPLRTALMNAPFVFSGVSANVLDRERPLYNTPTSFFYQFGTTPVRDKNVGWQFRQFRLLLITLVNSKTWVPGVRWIHWKYAWRRTRAEMELITCGVSSLRGKKGQEFGVEPGAFGTIRVEMRYISHANTRWDTRHVWPCWRYNSTAWHYSLRSSKQNL